MTTQDQVRQGSQVVGRESTVLPPGPVLLQTVM